ncbi:MAG: shikimate dehydrogenase [Pseudonocardia sp.]
MTPPRRAAVLGSPIAHSLSPVLHRAAYAALGLDDWSYDARECTEAELADVVDGLGPEWAGLSLTMPLKRVALDVADEVTPLAAATGAANTLVLRTGRRVAHNTDVAGIVAALHGATGRALVLGAGGTAQAALAALRELGIVDVTVAVRSIARAGELRDAAHRLGTRPTITAALADADPVLPPAEIVVSTLPAGAADALRVGPSATVLDVVYAPWPTPFAAAAAARGARVVSGLEMLLHQAVAQVELMTGRPGPVAAMRAALDAAVAARA